MSVVSVVLPTYRGGLLLREAVASVQAQTLTDWELVIVSDGCKDDFSDIEALGPHVSVFKQRNRGISIARNVGVSLANSELIAFLDDDDRMLPGRLRAQVDAMSDRRVGLCHTQYQFIDELGAIIGIGNSKDSQYGDFLRDEGVVLFASSMIRKSVFHEVGGFSSLFPKSEDVDLLYRLAREGPFLFLPEVLTEYRRHSANTSVTMLGSWERRLILEQHLFASEVLGQKENTEAIRLGLKFVPSDRAVKAMHNAYMARHRNQPVAMIVALGLALVSSPRFTIRVCSVAVRNKIASKRTGEMDSSGLAR
jgi:glycosyltransferase involved in cell wall biosynthesis